MCNAVQSLLQGALLCGLLVGFGCQRASDEVSSQPPQASNSMNPRADQQLWLTPPKGWVLMAQAETSATANSVRHARYQDPTEPAHRLTIESRDNATLKAPLGTQRTDPLELLAQIAEHEAQDCNKAEDFNTFTGFEHGFATAVRLFICAPNELATGRLTLLKIIQGQDQTYLVALEHQWSTATETQPNAALGIAENSGNAFDRVAAWSLYMRSVRVCAASGCQQQAN